MPATQADLKRILGRVNGRSYKAYKEIAGQYDFPRFRLSIDHVQGDPFASPSRLRVRVTQDVAQYPVALFRNGSRQTGLESYLAAAFHQACRAVAGRSGSGKSGLIEIDGPGQQVLAQTAVIISPDFVEARFRVGLPARGRTILGHVASNMLCETIPQLVEAALVYQNGRSDLMRAFALNNEDADALRQQLSEKGLVAFVADKAVLPRRSGIDDRPLKENGVVAFRSPNSLRVTMTLPNRGEVTGMGIPAGVTLIVGGGFHGKSTLLNGLERGVYNHRPGDGREMVVTNEKAVKIRAEDGRFVSGVDISPFINNLPFGQPTNAFSTDNASGSTSQAANILEALEMGAELLLIDEDTAATNFMIRDQRMQALIAKDKEPITPFIDKVRQLYDESGVSTILVIGGSGDYFDVADHVIALDSYAVSDVTAAAKQIASQSDQRRQREGGQGFGMITHRCPQPRSLNPRKGRRDVNVKTRGLDTIQFGESNIELDGVAQLVNSSQTRAIAAALVYASERYVDGKRPFADIINCVMGDIAQHGLNVISDYRYPVGDLAYFRPFELAAAFNRLRTLRVSQL